MILKHWGSLGDERIPPPFRGEEFDVLGVDGAIGWVLIAINNDSVEKSKTPSWSYPSRTKNGNQQGHLVLGEFRRRLNEKTNFRGDITMLSINEVDDMLMQVYAYIELHNTGTWRPSFQADGRILKAKYKSLRKIYPLLRGPLRSIAIAISTEHVAEFLNGI